MYFFCIIGGSFGDYLFLVVVCVLIILRVAYFLVLLYEFSLEFCLFDVLVLDFCGVFYRLESVVWVLILLVCVILNMLGDL